jgi:hypothetical protein
MPFMFLDFASGRYILWKNKSVGEIVWKKENYLATTGNRTPDFLAAQPIHWLELSQFINTLKHMVRTSVCKQQSLM